MSFDFENDKPIFIQIIEKLKIDIVSKKYLPNQKLPSVREFSFTFEVNPNTVQKALNELEDLGLIYTERTNGKFVTENTDLINSVRKEIINENVNKFYLQMSKIGVTDEEIKEIINKKGD